MSTSLSAPSDTWDSPRYLMGRVYLFSAVLLVEYAALVSIPHPWCRLHPFVAAAIVFFAILLFLSRHYLKTDRIPLELSRHLLAWHGAAILLVLLAYWVLLQTSWGGTPVVAVWFIAIPLSALLLLFALIPGPVIPSLLRRTRVAWFYAAVASLLTFFLSDRLQAAWMSPQNWISLFLQHTTFSVVGWALRLIYPHITFDLATDTIFLPNFSGTIAGSCSGIEGLSLTFLFCVGWLWYTRRELRFPRALLLLPCAMALIWTLNIVRLVVLLAIGNAGYAAIADNGFHSEAGWIAFNLVSLGTLTVADRVQWLRRSNNTIGQQTIAAPEISDQAHDRNTAAIYLLPFLAILASAFFSKAVSSGFEWAYPLRFFATAAVLWRYRAEYRRINWAFSWKGPVIGAIVFAMWIGLSRWTSGPANNTLGISLAALPTTERIGWLVIRVIAAVVTVPIAEELAFRGFLLRRIDSAGVESLAYKAVTPLAILLSSIAFGLMHGKLWIAGTVAGVAYALLVKRTGRLGEAIAAHSTTNMLLAVWVLARGEWSLW